MVLSEQKANKNTVISQFKTTTEIIAFQRAGVTLILTSDTKMQKKTTKKSNAVHLRVNGILIFSISLRSRLNCSGECSLPSPLKY